MNKILAAIKAVQDFLLYAKKAAVAFATVLSLLVAQGFLEGDAQTIAVALLAALNTVGVFVAKNGK